MTKGLDLSARDNTISARHLGRQRNHGHSKGHMFGLFRRHNLFDASLSYMASGRTKQSANRAAKRKASCPSNDHTPNIHALF